MDLLLQIAMFVYGLFVLAVPRLQITPRLTAGGGWARLGGLLMLLPLAAGQGFPLLVGLALMREKGPDFRTEDLDAWLSVFNAVSVLTTLAAVFGVLLIVAFAPKKPGDPHVKPTPNE